MSTPGSMSGILIEAEDFDNHGGWVVDSQFETQMGSPYLLAHGLGRPVTDATTTIDVAQGIRRIRRHDTYCSKSRFIDRPLGLRPSARRAIGRPSSRSSPATNSGAPRGRPVPSDLRNAS
jgi:hypothetical protein